MISRRTALGLMGLGAVAAPAAALGSPSARTSGVAKVNHGASELYPFRIGTLEACVISDGQNAAPVRPIFAREATPAQLAELLQSSFLPQDQAQFDYNCLLVRVGSELMLVDTGCGEKGRRDTGSAIGRLASNLKQAGVDPSEITTVVLTHFHRDHLGGLVGLDGQLAFPRARVLMARAEADFWQKPDFSKASMPADMLKEATAAAQALLALLRRSGRLELVEGTPSICGGAVTLLPTPGHTPGHISVRITSGSESLVAAGDIFHNHVLVLAHPEWTVLFDVDPARAVARRQEFLARAASERTRLLAFHLPFPGLGHVRAAGQGYEWVPEPWHWLRS